MDEVSAGGVSLAINGIALIVSLATLIVIAVATARLYAKARAPGSGYMLASLIGALLGIPAFAVYLAIMGNEAAGNAEDLFNLYEVGWVAFGALGYWRLSGAIVARKED